MGQKHATHLIIIMTTPTPPPSISRCDDDDIDRILLEACPTLFEVDDDDDAVEDALGTIGIPPPADRNRHHHHQRADGKDGRRGKTTNNGSAKKNIKAEEKNDTIDRGIGRIVERCGRAPPKDEKSFSLSSWARGGGGRCLDRSGVERRRAEDDVRE